VADEVAISLLPIGIIDPRDCFASLAKTRLRLFQQAPWGGIAAFAVKDGSVLLPGRAAGTAALPYL